MASVLDDPQELSILITKLEKKSRKGNPVKLDNQCQILENCLCPETSFKFENFMNIPVTTEKRFLARNIRQKMNILINKSLGRTSAAKKRTTQNTLQKILLKRKNENVIFNIEFERIDNWSETALQCSAHVDSSTAFVFDDGQILVIKNPTALVSVSGGTSENETWISFKKIELEQEKQQNVRMIFLAVNVPKFLDRTFYRFGSFLIYDRDKNMDNRHKGVHRITLVSREDHPEYEKVIGAIKRSSGVCAIENHLKLIDQANNDVKNAHLPQLIIRTEKNEDGAFFKRLREMARAEERRLEEIRKDLARDEDWLQLQGSVSTIPHKQRSEALQMLDRTLSDWKSNTRKRKADPIGQFECPVCYEPFDGDSRRPRIMRCGHSLCPDCLTRICEDTKKVKRSRLVKCPMCAKKTKTKRAKMEEFPKNFLS